MISRFNGCIVLTGRHHVGVADRANLRRLSAAVNTTPTLTTLSHSRLISTAGLARSRSTVDDVGLAGAICGDSGAGHALMVRRL